jgi:hypothetical protein
MQEELETRLLALIGERAAANLRCDAQDAAVAAALEALQARAAQLATLRTELEVAYAAGVDALKADFCAALARRR